MAVCQIDPGCRPPPRVKAVFYETVKNLKVRDRLWNCARPGETKCNLGSQLKPWTGNKQLGQLEKRVGGSVEWQTKADCEGYVGIT